MGIEGRINCRKRREGFVKLGFKLFMHLKQVATDVIRIKSWCCFFLSQFFQPGNCITNLSFPNQPFNVIKVGKGRNDLSFRVGGRVRMGERRWTIGRMRIGKR
jgi:hypothetical protein